MKMKSYFSKVVCVCFLLFSVEFVFGQAVEGTVITDDISNLIEGNEKVPEKKVALVIGNAHYGYGPNSKASMDAMAIASVLGDTGFTVSLVLDSDQRKLLDSIQQFSREIRNADVSFFYYSGNGINSNSVNYLVPINAAITNVEDLTYKAVNMNDITDKISKTGCKKNIVIVDACLDAGILGEEGDSDVNQGLTMTSMSNNVESLVVFASAPALLISEVTGTNSPFTESLLKNIVEPGIDIRLAFGKITKEVRIATNNRQIVATNSTLTDVFCLVPALNASPTLFTKKEPIEVQATPAPTVQEQPEEIVATEKPKEIEIVQSNADKYSRISYGTITFGGNTLFDSDRTGYGLHLTGKFYSVNKKRFWGIDEHFNFFNSGFYDELISFCLGMHFLSFENSTCYFSTGIGMTVSSVNKESEKIDSAFYFSIPFSVGIQLWNRIDINYQFTFNFGEVIYGTDSIRIGYIWKYTSKKLKERSSGKNYEKDYSRWSVK